MFTAKQTMIYLIILSARFVLRVASLSVTKSLKEIFPLDIATMVGIHPVQIKSFPTFALLMLDGVTPSFTESFLARPRSDSSQVLNLFMH